MLLGAGVTAAEERKQLEAAFALLTLDSEKSNRELYALYQTEVSDSATWLPQMPI